MRIHCYEVKNPSEGYESVFARDKGLCKGREAAELQLSLLDNGSSLSRKVYKDFRHLERIGNVLSTTLNCSLTTEVPSSASITQQDWLCISIYRNALVRRTADPSSSESPTRSRVNRLAPGHESKLPTYIYMRVLTLKDKELTPS